MIKQLWTVALVLVTNTSFATSAPPKIMVQSEKSCTTGLNEKGTVFLENLKAHPESYTETMKATMTSMGRQLQVQSQSQRLGDRDLRMRTELMEMLPKIERELKSLIASTKDQQKLLDNAKIQKPATPEEANILRQGIESQQRAKTLIFTLQTIIQLAEPLVQAITCKSQINPFQ